MKEYGTDIAKVHIKYNRDEQRGLWKRMQEGDLSARDNIIFSCLPLVVDIATKFRTNNKHIDLEDLVQEGNIALLQAVDKWDVERSSITTVATWYVRNALIDMIHDGKYLLKNPLSLSRRAAEEISKINRAKSELDTDDVKKISEKTNFTEKRIKKLISVSHNKRYSPQDVVIELEEDEVEKKPCVADLIGLAEENLSSLERKIFFKWSGLKTKKIGVKKISEQMDFTIKETMSILSKAKRKLKSAAKVRENNYA
mgnify:CR=1 FL=1|jgi:RNA polymerase sigma factor (sigma-70 family)|tara:strand:+ start:6564 stop:7328 length:765 start_codon:yes stop_codon:yes gene_type:complete